MSLIQALLLGLLQGLTEFLPVSSSGHLVISQNLLGLSQPPVLFDIAVHTGTALAIVVVLWPILLQLNKRLLGLIFVASLPAGIIGILLNAKLELLFSSLLLVAQALLVTAALLFATRFFITKAKRSQLQYLDAFIIGSFQALAIIPGISRSGSTIAAALFRGIQPALAFNFSFFLALPAILGAQLLQLPRLINLSSDQIPILLIGFFTAFISGSFALKLLKKLVIKGQLSVFAYYCLILGGLVLGRLFLF